MLKRLKNHYYLVYALAFFSSLSFILFIINIIHYAAGADGIN